MGRSYSFKGILTTDGWKENMTVTLDAHGCIESVQKGESGKYINGYLLPGFQNAHSHAFQYAMAGLAETHSGGANPDTFWSWRNAMYQVALSVSPEQLENIAAMLYSQMVRHGYTAVAEFHYLHHDKNGKPYDNLAEMGERLVRAAERAGIRITLIPMFYQKGGFGQPPGEGQRRFISQDHEAYWKLLEASRMVVNRHEHASLGLGVHSLRAVDPQDVIEMCNDLDGSLPFHIHIAEQLKEIQDCVNYHGQRPVEWLLQHCPVNENYHLVHATHLEDTEVSGIARSGAHVVLCPSTEGNLGDGLFRLKEFTKAGGRWSIGTDSHVGLNPLEELRILDYGQRVTSHTRSTFTLPGNGNSGFNGIRMAWQSGRRAMGKPAERFFAVGAPLDGVVVDANHPLIAVSAPRDLCNTIVYTADASSFLGTLINGEWVVTNGVHRAGENIIRNFQKTMNEIR